MNNRELAAALSDLQRRHDELIRDLPAVCLAAISGNVKHICAEHKVMSHDGERITEEALWNECRELFLDEIKEGLANLGAGSQGRARCKGGR